MACLSEHEIRDIKHAFLVGAGCVDSYYQRRILKLLENHLRCIEILKEIQTALENDEFTKDWDLHERVKAHLQDLEAWP